MVRQSLAEKIRAYARILAGNPGVVPAGDVAWKLRQILGDQAPDAPVTFSASVKLRSPGSLNASIECLADTCGLCMWGSCTHPCHEGQEWTFVYGWQVRESYDRSSSDDR